MIKIFSIRSFFLVFGCFVLSHFSEVEASSHSTKEKEVNFFYNGRKHDAQKKDVDGSLPLSLVVKEVMEEISKRDIDPKKVKITFLGDGNQSHEIANPLIGLPLIFYLKRFKLEGRRSITLRMDVEEATPVFFVQLIKTKDDPSQGAVAEEVDGLSRRKEVLSYGYPYQGVTIETIFGDLQRLQAEWITVMASMDEQDPYFSFFQTQKEIMGSLLEAKEQNRLYLKGDEMPYHQIGKGKYAEKVTSLSEEVYQDGLKVVLVCPEDDLQLPEVVPSVRFSTWSLFDPKVYGIGGALTLFLGGGWRKAEEALKRRRKAKKEGEGQNDNGSSSQVQEPTNEPKEGLGDE